MSFFSKLQDNKGLMLALGGALTAGVTWYFLHHYGCCSDKKSCCPAKKTGSCCPAKTIYERLGGKVNIDAAVVSFYEKVVKDPRVKHFFKNTDFKRQTKQQQDFLCFAFGGPNNYTGKNMTDAHKGMNINNEQFDAIVENLGKTLIEMGVSTELVNEIAAACEPLRKEIIHQ